jgi:MSHA biogenesis protein MshL
VIHNLFKSIFIVSIVVVITGCASDQPLRDNYDNNMDNIRYMLNKAADSNQELARQALDVEMPLSVSDAMMPSTKSGFNGASNEKRFDVSVQDVSANTFFSGLAKDTDDSLVLSPKLEGSVTLDMKNVSLSDVLKAVRDIYGFRYEKTSYGYNIYPKQMESKVFMVNQLAISRTGTAQTHLNSSTVLGSSSSDSSSDVTDQSTSTITTTSTDTFWDDVKSTIDSIIKSGDDEGGSGTPAVSVNQNTGLVYVRAYPQEMDQVMEFLERTDDILGREVIIEAQILDVELSRQYSSGIDWTVLTSSGTTTTADIVSAGSGLLSNIYQLSMSGDSGNFSYAIELLSTQGQVSILSQPRVSASNNQDAIIKVGEDEYFVTSVTSDITSDSDGNTTSSTIGLDPFFSGVSLEITPQITDNKEVNLYIHPMITRTTEDNKEIQVDGQTSNLPLAKTVLRETDTIVKASNGQVIIIGGLMQTDVVLDESGVPLSSAYGGSVVSNLLKAKASLAGKHELVILLKPTIVDNGQAWNNALRKTANRNFKTAAQEGFMKHEG